MGLKLATLQLMRPVYLGRPETQTQHSLYIAHFSLARPAWYEFGPCWQTKFSSKLAFTLHIKDGFRTCVQISRLTFVINNAIYILIAMLQTFQRKQLRSHYLAIYSWIENRNSGAVEHRGTVGIFWQLPYSNQVGQICFNHIGMSQPFFEPFDRLLECIITKTLSFI